MPANPADSRNAADRVQIAPVEGGAALFILEFRDYLVHLCDEFTARAHALRSSGTNASRVPSSRVGCRSR